MTLLTFTAVSCAAARRAAGRPAAAAVDLLISCMPGPQHQTRRSGVRRPNDGTVDIACPRGAQQQTHRTLLLLLRDGTDRQKVRQTDAVPLHRPYRIPSEQCQKGAVCKTMPAFCRRATRLLLQ